MSVKIDEEAQKFGQILQKYREQAKVTQLEIAAGVTIIKVLYEVGKEMNQFRTCMSGQNRRR